MATLKHLSSKNADYGAAEQYLLFEHDEFTRTETAVQGVADRQAEHRPDFAPGRAATAERSRAMSDNLPHMDYRQHRRARRLVHECCNYDEGNCLLLDDGEPCVCVQSISFSLMCHWFRVAVLPLDGELAAALLCRGSRKRCAVCGAAFVPKSNRGKYCPDCAGRMKKIKAAERKRKQRQRCHALEPFKPA